MSQLDIRLPFGAFNGGSLATPDLTLVEAHRLAPEVARAILALLARRGVDAWVFARGDWRLRDPEGVRVSHERHTVGFDPTVVETFDDVIGEIDKIVGVADDFAKLAQIEAEAQSTEGSNAAIILSQPYYLDITHPQANKGDGVSALCDRVGVSLSRPAVIGDMFNDVQMFARAGYSIAMGQAPEAVKQRANALTGPNTEDGFANAVNHLILPAVQSKTGADFQQLGEE